MVIQVSNLCVKLNGADILKGMDFVLEAGELVGLIGPNGAGKSTLLKALGGLVPMHDGIITIGGAPLNNKPYRQRAQLIAYLPQSSVTHWNINVETLVELGRLPHQSKIRDDEAVSKALELTGLTDFRHRSVNSLSGGERMRALLARALAVEAPILLADEPIAALDPLHQLQTLALLRKQAHAGKTVIIAIHDLNLASRYCDRLLLLNQGELIANGSANEVLNDHNIGKAFRIVTHNGNHEGVTYILPWKPLQI